MQRDDVIARLRARSKELRAAGIESLSLFGSTVRQQATERSDVDLLARFDETRRLSLLDVVRLERELSELLERPVDLVEESELRPPMRERILREAIRAF
jgi:uncharacterized protein